MEPDLLQSVKATWRLFPDIMNNGVLETQTLGCLSATMYLILSGQNLTMKDLFLTPQWNLANDIDIQYTESYLRYQKKKKKKGLGGARISAGGLPLGRGLQEDMWKKIVRCTAS